MTIVPSRFFNHGGFRQKKDRQREIKVEGSHRSQQHTPELVRCNALLPQKKQGVRVLWVVHSCPHLVTFHLWVEVSIFSTAHITTLTRALPQQGWDSRHLIARRCCDHRDSWIPALPARGVNQESVLIILGETGRVIKKGSLVKQPPSRSNPLENFDPFYAFSKKTAVFILYILSTSLNIGAKSAEDFFALFVTPISEKIRGGWLTRFLEFGQLTNEKLR